MNNSAEDRKTLTRCVLRLFVDDGGPNSRIALANVERLRRRFAPEACDVEIIDVRAHPELALEQGVYMTPALQILEPAPGATIFGNLSDEDPLRMLLTEGT
ncbi:MAG: circadian clock KaiB family protein [Planctomycetota bacterium]